MITIILHVLSKIFLSSVQLQAQDSSIVNHGASVNITAHSVCRRITNNHASGSSIMVPTKNATEWSTGANAFINAPPPGVTVAACGCTVTPGSQTFSTAGSFSFTVPCHNSMTVELWGGGGGGAQNWVHGPHGGNGGASSWDGGAAGSKPQANGGLGANGDIGTGGAGLNCDVSGNGVNGSSWLTQFRGGPGGAAAGSGGAGGAAPGTAGPGSTVPGNPGIAPGGGGSGGSTYDEEVSGGGGGGGGYCRKVYSSGVYTVSSSVTVSIGSGGSASGGGAGAVGRVRITWN